MDEELLRMHSREKITHFLSIPPDSIFVFVTCSSRNRIAILPARSTLSNTDEMKISWGSKEKSKRNNSPDGLFSSCRPSVVLRWVWICSGLISPLRFFHLLFTRAWLVAVLGLPTNSLLQTWIWFGQFHLQFTLPKPTSNSSYLYRLFHGVSPCWKIDCGYWGSKQVIRLCQRSEHLHLTKIFLPRVWIWCFSILFDLKKGKEMFFMVWTWIVFKYRSFRLHKIKLDLWRQWVKCVRRNNYIYTCVWYRTYSKEHGRHWSRTLSNLFKCVYAFKIKLSLGMYSSLTCIIQNRVLVI